MLGEALAAAEEIELHSEGEAGDLAAQFFDELDGGFHGAAGGKQVIYQQDALAGLNGIAVDLEGVGAVFEIVSDPGYRRGQLARFAHWNKTGVEAVGKRGAEDESARFDAEDEVDLALEVMRGEGVDKLGEAGRIFEQRSDVVEENAGLGEVRHGAHKSFERFYVYWFLCLWHELFHSWMAFSGRQQSNLGWKGTGDKYGSASLSIIEGLSGGARISCGQKVV